MISRLNDRHIRMSGHDKIFERRAKEKSFREGRAERMSLSVTAVARQYSTDEESQKTDDDMNDTELLEPLPGCSSQSTDVTLHFPRAIMASEEICSTADRLSLSDNNNCHGNCCICVKGRRCRS